MRKIQAFHCELIDKRIRTNNFILEIIHLNSFIINFIDDLKKYQKDSTNINYDNK